MILAAANWCYILILTYLFGKALTELIKRITGYQITEWEMIIALGIMTLTVYAQGFSLFAPVGGLANTILCIIAIIFIVVWRKDFLCSIRSICAGKSGRKGQLALVMLGMVVLLFIILSCQRALHADTDGYHAQAIRWIEEYGVVKGLGNLYHRFAYNSAFMSLQALFSWKFLVGQSMHVMNGFICCVMFIYGIMGIIRSNQKSLLGNLFRLLLLAFIVLPQSLSAMSSPNTDTLALLLVVFVLCKWCDYLEQQETEAIPYAILTILAVFSVSVKLSAAFLILLAIKPIFQMIRERRWRTIGFFLGMGLIVILPFLCRNVLISGYLVYPYSSVDLFDVEWKMLPSVVECDKKEIMTWGRALYDIGKSDYHLWQWYPIWWAAQEIWVRVMTVLNVILILPGIVVICNDIKNRNYDRALLVAETMILLLGWFFTAPLQRYGAVFLFLLPVSILGVIIKGRKQVRVLKEIEVLAAVCCILLLLMEMKDMEPISLKRSAYYVKRECEEVKWHGMSVYVPLENGNMGYYYIPATQHKALLEIIEPMGIEIADGFRVKREYRNMEFDTSGRILSVQ